MEFEAVSPLRGRMNSEGRGSLRTATRAERNPKFETIRVSEMREWEETPRGPRSCIGQCCPGGAQFMKQAVRWDAVRTVSRASLTPADSNWGRGGTRPYRAKLRA